MRVEPRAVCALATLLNLGCGGRAIQIGALEPAPSIRVAPPGPLALSLTPRTPDQLRVETDGFRTVEIRAFRLTLENAFARAFGSPSVPAAAGAEGLRLVLEVHTISLVTSRVSDSGAARAGDGAEILLVHGGGHLRPAKAPRKRRYVLLEFSAALLDGTREVGRVSAKVASHDPAAENTESVARAISSAVASLYEKVARDLFARRTAAQRR